MSDVYYGFGRHEFGFQMPRLVLGWGALEKLGHLAAERGMGRVALVTDEGLVRLGLVEKARDALRSAGIESEVFAEVEPEPSVETTQRAAAFLQKVCPDGVVGMGGGSCMDVAKAASVGAVPGVSVKDCLGMDRVPGPGLPKILIPTTAGTASEVTHISVLTDLEDNGAKKVMYSRFLLADIALVDPQLTVGLPPRLSAATGLDALTHAIEGYVSVHRNPMSDMCAERSIRLIGSNLRTAVLKGGHSPEARYNMSLAATLAGLSFVNSSVGAVHAVSLPFGGKYKVGHGESNAVVLPHVMRYCVPADVSRYRDIAVWLGVPETAGSPREIALQGVEAVEMLIHDCGLDPRLSVYGVTREDFGEFVDTIFQVQSHNLERNPRDLTREDLLKIYESAY